MRCNHIIPTILIVFGVAACASIDIDDEESDRSPATVFEDEGPEEEVVVESPSPRRGRRERPPSEAELVNRRFQQALAERDLIVGMDMSDVRNVWGEPTEIQIAGDSRLGNQRWFYFKGFATPWSMGEARVIYFEEGRVAGWSTR